MPRVRRLKNPKGGPVDIPRGEISSASARNPARNQQRKKKTRARNDGQWNLRDKKQERWGRKSETPLMWKRGLRFLYPLIQQACACSTVRKSTLMHVYLRRKGTKAIAAAPLELYHGQRRPIHGHCRLGVDGDKLLKPFTEGGAPHGGDGATMERSFISLRNCWR